MTAIALVALPVLAILLGLGVSALDEILSQGKEREEWHA